MLANNIRCLATAEELVSNLDDQQFTRLPVGFTASVGTHLRHVVDHYDAFLDGVSKGQIDYDRRRRDQDCEGNRSIMIMRLRELRSRMEALSATDSGEQRVQVLTRSATDDQVVEMVASSVGRELGFLHSHTIHHFAQIAASLRSQGIAVEDDFGVAPSTLRFRLKQSNTVPKAG